MVHAFGAGLRHCAVRSWRMRNCDLQSTSLLLRRIIELVFARLNTADHCSHARSMINAEVVNRHAIGVRGQTCHTGGLQACDTGYRSLVVLATVLVLFTA